jgi:hypothetical protein
MVRNLNPEPDILYPEPDTLYPEPDTLNPEFKHPKVYLLRIKPKPLTPDIVSSTPKPDLKS